MLADVQRQLASLQCPPGVPHELWASLTGELSLELARRSSASPLAAGPPIDELSTVIDLTASEPTAGNLRLHWSYKNTGDYDQNSETNISDLTPIGLHFAKTSNSQDWARACVADGDLNTEVNIADITPIGRCFMQTVTKYQVEFKPASGSYVAFSQIATLPFDAGVIGESDWLEFEQTLPDAKTGYYRVVPYYQDLRGIEGEAIYVYIEGVSPPNQPPTAVLNADPEAGSAPLTVNFDASASHDPENRPLQFEWDWDGDGSYDHYSGTLAQLQHEFPDVGDYNVQLQVTDNLGATDTATLAVSCLGWQTFDAVDSTSRNDLQIIAGKPMVRITVDLLPGELNGSSILLSRAAVKIPSSPADWVNALILPAGVDEHGQHVNYSSGSYSGLFELGGKPAVVDYIPHDSAWWFSQATTAEPGGPEDWNTCQMYAGDISGAGNLAILVVDGMVHAFFENYGKQQLLLARALVESPQQAEDWETTTVVQLGSPAYSQLAISAACISGKLCLAYEDPQANTLRYATCAGLEPTGPGDWAVTVIDADGNCGRWARLMEVDGRPVIASVASNQEAEGHHHHVVRLARSQVSEPASAADWVLSTPLSTDDGLIYCWVAEVRESPAILTAHIVPNNEYILTALFPPGPEAEDLDQPWIERRVSPNFGEYDWDYPDVEVHNDRLFCVYTTGHWEVGPDERHLATAMLAP